VLLLGVLGLKTKTATARNNFGEWPLAIFSEVFFYFIRLHAPRSGCGQRQRYPSAGCNWASICLARIRTSLWAALCLGLLLEKRVPIVLADCGRVNALVMD